MPSRSSLTVLVLAMVGCTPSRRDTPPTTTAQPPAAAVSPPAAPVPGAPAAPAPAAREPSPQGAASAPGQVELPREVAPGSGSEGDPGEKRAGHCTADRDCRAFAHYCEGCFCVPLARSAADLKCRGARTSCFVDPCRDQRAACVKGNCVLVGAAEK